MASFGLMGLEVLPILIKGLLQKEEPKNRSHVDKDDFRYSENFSRKAENIQMYVLKEYSPHVDSDNTNKSKEISEDFVVLENDENHVSFSHESENVSDEIKDDQRISVATSSTEKNVNTEQVPAEDKSFIWFTYYDKNLNIKDSKEPPYCVIEEKFVGYPPRNPDDVKKLLELSESHNNKDRDPLVYVPLRYVPRITKSVKKKWTRQEYINTRNNICQKITFFYRTGVIIWLPLVNCRIPLVHDLAKKFGDIVMIHDRWIRDRESSEDSWGGVIVIYASPEEAEMAKTEIPKMHGFMKTLGLSELLHCLISAELEHFKETKTELFLNVPSVNNGESMRQLKMFLQTFGQVIPEDCYQIIGQRCIRITTAYSCATYAYLAMTVLDGLPFNDSKLTAEVGETNKEKAILKDFAFHLRDYIGTAAFLFNGIC